MSSKFFHLTQRKAALLAGFSLLIMAIAAGFSFGYVFQHLIIPNDAKITSQNIDQSTGLYLTGVIGWIIVFICDLFVSWGLMVFLKDLNKTLVKWMFWLRIIYTAFLGVAIFYLFTALNCINAPELMLEKIQQFSSLWSTGLIVFGAHLFVLGLLLYKSGFVPKLLGFLAIFAGISYFGIHLGNQCISNFEAYKATLDMMLGLPIALGEICLAFWLVIKGGK